jgi:hypothetical protein
MNGGHSLAFLQIPYSVLVALDSRAFHYALQPYHYIVRAVHVLSMAAFFGGIALLDLRLLGWRSGLALRAYAEHVLPCLYVTFGIAVVSGVVLFLYDPVAVGSHAYFTPKLILIVLGLVNAALYHRTGYIAALAAERRLPRDAMVAGAVSLVIWTAVVVCASLNVEAAPKVLLR